MRSSVSRGAEVPVPIVPQLSQSLFICSRGTIGDDRKEAAAALSFCRNTHWSSLCGKWLICDGKHFSAELLPKKSLITSLS